MKLFLRILLCKKCLIISFLSFSVLASSSFASTELQSFQSSATHDDLTLQKGPELLDPEYVRIEVAKPTASFSAMGFQTLADLGQYIQAKTHSLLNWNVHRRTTNLEIGNYDRKTQFGRWINDPNDTVCFNTRAKVLVRDAVGNVTFKDSNHCVVNEGRWLDPYTQSIFNEAPAVQIDHLVALKNAYLSGAYKWSFRERCLYANYLGYDYHLLPVSGTENMRKGDRSPDKYMPPDQNYACTYIRNWLAVKTMWGLTMTPAEADSIRQQISDRGCLLSQFKISDSELRNQRKFARENIDLCEKLDKGL